MKRKIPVSEYIEYSARASDIHRALTNLGFSGNFIENQINSVLEKLHKTEEALELERRASADLRAQNENQFETIEAFQGLTGLSHPDCALGNVVVAVKVGDVVRVEGFGMTDSGGSYIASTSASFEVLSDGSNGIVKTFLLQQIDRFGKRFGSRVEFSIRNIVSIERRERRVKERRGEETWLIDRERIDAIKALGALSPRTPAQTEVLKDLISSVRKDGSSTFRTPGSDRRKK